MLDRQDPLRCHRVLPKDRAIDPFNASKAIATLPQLSLHTQIGDITVSEDDGAVVAVDWGWGRDQSETPLLKQARSMLAAYFDGKPHPFDLPLRPLRGSAYQRQVWAALCTIPYGAVRTYGEIARLAGGSPRSVGMANAANSIPILIPCHRVVAAGGIGGYSGGDGVATKRMLLALEAFAIGAARPVAPMTTVA